MATPSKGKKFVKLVKGKSGRMKKISYGQKGSKIKPGTAKGNAYCKRSNAIKGGWRKDPNSKNNLSRRRWKCSGNYSRKSVDNEITVTYIEDNTVTELSLIKSVDYPEGLLLGDNGLVYTFDEDKTLLEFSEEDVTKSVEDDVMFDDEAVRLESETGERLFFNKNGLYKDLTVYDDTLIEIQRITFA